MEVITTYFNSGISSSEDSTVSMGWVGNDAYFSVACGVFLLHLSQRSPQLLFYDDDTRLFLLTRGVA